MSDPISAFVFEAVGTGSFFSVLLNPEENGSNASNPVDAAGAGSDTGGGFTFCGVWRLLHVSTEFVVGSELWGAGAGLALPPKKSPKKSASCGAWTGAAAGAAASDFLDTSPVLVDGSVWTGFGGGELKSPKPSRSTMWGVWEAGAACGAAASGAGTSLSEPPLSCTGVGS